jgi:hypothetical protein
MNEKRRDSYVTQVSIGGIDLGTEFFIERQPPESVVLGLPGDA